jgi:hypothetical protein
MVKQEKESIYGMLWQVLFSAVPSSVLFIIIIIMVLFGRYGHSPYNPQKKFVLFS